MKGFTMRAVSATRFAPLGVLLLLCTPAACGGGGGGGDLTGPSTEPAAFSTTDLVVGTGDPVTPGQPVAVAATIWDYDAQGTDGKGSVLDQQASVEYVHGDPSFPEGWTMGLEGMRVGGRRRVVVPRGLGFTGPVVLELELLTASPSLLVTTDLVVGTGNAVVNGQTLTMAYTGWVYDPNVGDNKGAIFDQASDFSFVLGSANVIDGWNRGFTGMRVGGRRRIVIPSVLGFGSAAQPNIPASSTLIFEVEVLTAG
jgi:FKBP-type peptidyl-prolyl cis-trans isomerase